MDRFEAHDAALRQMSEHGLRIESFEPDGVLRRVPVEGDHGSRRSGWYVAHEHSREIGEKTRCVVIGAFGNFKLDGGESRKISSSLAGLSSEEREHLRHARAKIREAAEREQKTRARETAERAEKIWAGLPEEGSSEYLRRKRVGSWGLRFSRGSVAVPLRDATGAWRGLQWIYADGNKRFLTGTAKRGAYHLIGEVAADQPLCVAEGYATAATIHEATDWPAIVAFDCGNLTSVVREARAVFPFARFLVCGDDDWQTDGNPGREKALEAARVGKGIAAFPVFSDERGTDWNDLHALEGLDAVREQLQPARDRLFESFRPGLCFSLDALLAEFTVIHGNGLIWDNERGRLMRAEHLRASAGSKLVDLWLSHPARRTIDQDQIVFDPQSTQRDVINLFRGFERKPDPKGRCDRILDHLAFLCGHNDGLIEWILRWVAYPIQRPGAKMQTSIVMHGAEGTGKNLFWEAIAEIYGRYAVIIGQPELESEFNGWASAKLFCIADEVISQQERRHVKGRLKGLITGQRIMINDKGMPQRQEPNHLNIVFLSNEQQPLMLDRGDRRYCVVHCSDVLQKSYYSEIASETRSGGIEALFHHLLNVDLGDYSPHTHPYGNKDRQSLISIGQSSSDRFLDQWTDECLPLPVVACRAMDLYRAFRVWCSHHGERYPPSETLFGRQIGARIDRERAWITISPSTQRRKCTIYRPEIQTELSDQAQIDRFSDALTDWLDDSKKVGAY